MTNAERIQAHNEELREAIEIANSLPEGGSVSPVHKKDVNFYDYDGTLLHSYTVNEFQSLIELPPLPEQPGLICQGWNWSLEDIKSHNREINVGAIYTTDDGQTRIYITLQEEAKSPTLGVCPKGTVIVDWGDGTDPDILTGTSTGNIVYTPNHEYKTSGDYVIKLIVDGEMGFYGNSSIRSTILRSTNSDSSDNRDYAYRNAIHKIHLGDNIKSIYKYAFSGCYSLASITVPNGISSINEYVFYDCYSLVSVNIPNGVQSIGSNMAENCYSLKTVTIPNGATTLGGTIFRYCSSLLSTTIPNSITSIGSDAFRYCHSLKSFIIPNGVKTISSNLFNCCYSIRTITIPDGVTSLKDNAFQNCFSLISIIIPSSVTNISTYAFRSCYSVRFYDFSKHTSIPTLSNTNAFTNIQPYCEIRVPAALYDEWIAATNWSTYASNIVAV